MTRELRDSGVGWLGVTSAAWPVVPARALFGERKQKSSATDVHLTPSQKYGVLPQAEYMEITGNKVVLNLSGADNMRHVEAGDYVSHLRSFQGGLEYAGIPGKVSAAYTVLKPKVALEPRFFKYLFKSDLYVQALQTTTDQLRDGQSIRYGQVTLIPLPYPNLDEQRAIADYLDRETAQIDAFIAKNEELITLLTERRAAEIELAVAPAELPATWESVQIRRLGPVSESGVSVNGYSVPAEGDEIGVLKTGAVSKGFFDPAENKRVVAEDLDRVATPVRAGSLIVNRANTPELVGSAGLVVESCPTLYLSDKLWQLTFQSANAAYVHYWTKTDAYRSQLRGLSVGASLSMQNLSFRDFLSVRISVPPLREQLELVARLDRTTEETDRAIGAARRSSELARERRGALIAAAVTGKIDVGRVG